MITMGPFCPHGLPIDFLRLSSHSIPVIEAICLFVSGTAHALCHRRISRQRNDPLRERSSGVRRNKAVVTVGYHGFDSGDFTADDRFLQGPCFDEHDAGELRTAVREAVDNAYRHGNKSQPEHKIYINYVLDQEKIVITVEDEGEGFDTEYYLALGREENAAARARKQRESGKTGGLGIMLMMKCLDTLEYNPVGNLAKLTKRI